MQGVCSVGKADVADYAEETIAMRILMILTTCCMLAGCNVHRMDSVMMQELDGLRNRADALELKIGSPHAEQNLRAEQRSLLSDFKAWAKKYNRQSKTTRVQKSDIIAGQPIILPELARGDPLDDPYKRHPKQNGQCPQYIETRRVACALTHEREQYCEYYCVWIDGGGRGPEL